nr:MAG TPA: hypothetical protein [Caudoviricetes sp.]
MNEITLESIIQCSKEAIARAYMCRAYPTRRKTSPFRGRI